MAESILPFCVQMKTKVSFSIQLQLDFSTIGERFVCANEFKILILAHILIQIFVYISNHWVCN